MAGIEAAIIAENLGRINDDIAAQSHDRPVRLVCVTKYASLEHVQLLLEAGASELGENLLPGAATRFEELSQAGYSFTRHLIGPQQSRKISQIPGKFDCFQALDRLKTVRLLDAALNKAGLELDVLLQVNISREEQKSGFAPEELEQTLELISSEHGRLRVRGLMAIPAGRAAFTSELQFVRETSRAFGQMRSMFDRISASYPAATPFDILSQGMSHDYKLALAEGANMIRIGSALFNGLEGK